jgi:UDP-N-acetylmuramate dehydrogenase
MIENLLIKKDFLLAPLTTLEIGGAARFFVEATNETEILAALKFACKNNLKVFILGGGSNLVVSDEGFDGLVIKINLRGVEFTGDGAVYAAAGENWDALVEQSVERNLAGIECLSGIPGTAGATPIQNVGAYGQEVSQTIKTVSVLDRADFKIKTLANKDCGFAYRASIFNTTAKDRFVILAVKFQLRPDGSPFLGYKDLQNFFIACQRKPTLPEVRRAVLEIRRAKSMLIDAKDENRRSVGSFFKNPIVTQPQLAVIEKTARQSNLISDDEIVPRFPVAKNYKIPAAWLIEKSGFRKGFKRGRVGISTRHTLALVNCGGATATEILDFAYEIQERVKNIFNLDLQPEPIFVFPSERKP